MLTDRQILANIAANVRRLRGDMTRSELARRLDVYAMAVTRIEEASHMPNSALLARLAEVLNTTADALLSSDARKIKNSA